MGDRRQETDIEDRIAQLEQQLHRLQSEREARNGRPSMTAVERAETLYELRRARNLFFGNNSDLFSEPAWDMLLDIFIAKERGTDLSVSDTCLGSGVPTTTALRWITALEQRGMITKVRDTQDGRRCFVRLTPQAYESLRLYLEAC